jgi:hypothetical protein
MKNKVTFFLFLFLVISILGGFVFYKLEPKLHLNNPQSQNAKAVYYCPMHPSYTSDRPGDCPICNMKLVKQEPAPAADTSSASPQTSKESGDVCYMHNCPMAQDGKPCPMLVVAKTGETVSCPICGHHVVEAKEKEKKILYWTDPMIPGYKSEKAGKSPMGMDLVPVYEEETPSSGVPSPSGYASIVVSPQKQQMIGVKTDNVLKKSISKTIRTVGRIAYDPSLYQAQEEYLQAIEALRKAKSSNIVEITEQAAKLVESTRLKLKLMGLNEEMMDMVEKSGKPDRSLLYSDAGNTVWLYAPIYEYEIPLVKVGNAVEVELSAASGKTFHGTIRAIDSVLDPMTRSVRVRALLDNPEGALKPEMYVNVTLQIPLGEVLVVPEEAVFRTGEKNVVFVVKQEGVFEPREVVLGVKTEKFQEIKSGVSEGEKVVVSGNFLIDSESRIKGALEGMSGGGHVHGS